VRRGNIGVVAASGTGLQAVTVGVHNLGAGISQAIGTGGRDLKEKVGAITALQGLNLLATDPHTKVIVLVSKPPEAGVISRLLATAQQIGKPVVINFIGHPPPAQKINNLHFATTLQEAAELAVNLSGAKWDGNHEKQLPGFVRALFSGGTLAYEMVLGLQNFLDPLFTNVPLQESQRIPNALNSQAHTILDLGEDEFTVGRLHPMMDNDLRIRRLRQEAEDPEVGMILLDLVLGEGAHPDPASELAPVVRDILAQRDLEMGVLVIGTEEDPQNLAEQVQAFESAGAKIFFTTTELTQHIAAHLSDIAEMGQAVEITDNFAAINVGLEFFAESLAGQGAEVVQVEWKPPAGGNAAMMDILAKLKSK
jgi:FdrA protein